MVYCVLKTFNEITFQWILGCLGLKVDFLLPFRWNSRRFRVWKGILQISMSLFVICESTLTQVDVLWINYGLDVVCQTHRSFGKLYRILTRSNFMMNELLDTHARMAILLMLWIQFVWLDLNWISINDSIIKWTFFNGSYLVFYLREFSIKFACLKSMVKQNKFMSFIVIIFLILPTITMIQWIIHI